MVKKSLRHSLIAITFVLVSSLVVSPIPALESPNRTIASSGTITYLSTNWYGVDFYRLVPESPPYDQSPLFYYHLLDLIKSFNKVNCIRIHTYANVPWGYFDSNYPYTKTWLQQACGEARAKDIKTLLSCFANEFAETDGAGKASIILNINGAGDRWVANYAQIIRECQPDAVEIMNEPPSKGDSGNPNLTFQAYRDFVVKCCTAFRAAKPDVSLFVMDCPYWDMKDSDGTGSWATKPLTEFSDVTYSVHLYYDTSTLAYFQWAKEYQAGNLTDAKVLLYNYILNDLGLKPLIDMGMQICWTELGAEVGASLPNWDAYLKDIYAFVTQYNQGLVQFALSPNPPEPYGILTADWTQLNALGLVWKAAAPS